MPVIACSFNTGWTCCHLLEEGPAVPVTLPHDAALAEPRTETAPGGTNTGWYEGYDYLYEKRFTPDAALQGPVFFSLQCMKRPCRRFRRGKCEKFTLPPFTFMLCSVKL